MDTLEAPLLSIRGLRKNFGGLMVLNGVDMDIPEGKITGLIGPNGAGKTTLFNAITGVFPINGGSIMFNGEDIAHLPPHRICHKGIGRTFQAGRPFLNLTVRQNIEVGYCYGGGGLRAGKSTVQKACEEILELTGLQDVVDVKARQLNLAERKLVELGRALATQPRLLLLDEVLAGLNPRDLEKAINIIFRIRKNKNITIFWIEHIMKVLMESCDHLIVLHYGTKLTEGKPETVSANEQVQEAYFGKRKEAFYD